MKLQKIKKFALVRLVAFALMVGACALLVFSYHVLGFVYTLCLWLIWRWSYRYAKKYLDD